MVPTRHWSWHNSISSADAEDLSKDCSEVRLGKRAWATIGSAEHKDMKFMNSSRKESPESAGDQCHFACDAA
jgi:hypothetical protein